jgi:hypothetical protein
VFRFASERDTAKYDLVKGDSHGPHIGLFVVDVGSEALLGHVDGRADVVVLPLDQAAPLAKSKIGDLEGTVGSNEYIGWLEVAVDEPSSVEVLVALEDLHKKTSSILLGKTASLLDEFGEVATRTVLSDDVAVVYREKRILVS